MDRLGLHGRWPPRRQPDRRARRTDARAVLGNPHSNNPTSLEATALVERCREQVCEFFHASPEEYLCVFTANATGALKLVGESYPFEPGGTFGLTFDNHNSVNGIREFARRKNANIAYVPVTAPELRLDRTAMTRVLSGADPSKPNLLAFPRPVEFFRRSTLPRPRRGGPPSGLGRARRRDGVRADQPLRRRQASGPISRRSRSPRSSDTRPASAAC